MDFRLTRRSFFKLVGSSALIGLINRSVPVYSASRNGIRVASRKETGNAVEYDLVIERNPLNIGLKEGFPITINDSFPAPLIRLKEGKRAILRVRNEMNVSTSIHWHGVILPFKMDGVPGVVFPGIAPKETFVYEFPVVQSGTYWYHSHTGLQEQLGHYGPLILEPREGEPFEYDREYVILLSDWTFENPEKVLMHLKKWDGYYNYQKRTLFDFFTDVEKSGLGKALKKSLMWSKMRMNPRDIADITAATYTYLMNGLTADENQTFLFNPGEKVRLRFINGSANTYFDVRIPGLKMTIVQADGQNVQPVEVDEFRIAVAETYDVIVEPADYRAYTVFAESMDRSGYTRGTLAPERGMKAPLPPRRPPAERGMKTMGMEMAMGMDMKAGKMAGQKMKPGMKKMNRKRFCEGCDVEYIPESFGVDAAMRVKKPICRLDDPGVGLENVRHKVLTYADLKSIEPFEEREPDRTVAIHLTGNMERFVWKMWAYDGKNLTSEFHQLIDMAYGERVRIVFVNHTMMDHPIHLHGTWMYVDNGNGEHNPRKHTINIKPAEKVCVEVEADAIGNWAFHCHLLYHMHTGMFRVVRIC